jgi:hypothetical protein
MSHRRSVATVDIEQVRTRFKNWRQGWQGKARIPDEARQPQLCVDLL